MKTPYGKECKYYYSDYFRGRESEECRLIENNPDSPKWFPALCQNCPAPDILLTNQCEHLHLYGRVAKSLFGLSKKVEVESFCDRDFSQVQDPRVGCGRCHEVDLQEFEVIEK
ncbi:MAG: hypothetical protein IT331_20870 [Anaerolineae bacterium]|nr:hypothetical protein [Anaerolineae bacterium]